ncbi:MAG: hypothetical protein OXH64_05050, partial [Rhodospirillaceae bacterium]|nr:hypothetical protein [Rhodospirillaceae bacterium]
LDRHPDRAQTRRHSDRAKRVEESRLDPGTANPEADDEIPPLRGLASAPVGMTGGVGANTESRIMTNHDIS